MENENESRIAQSMVVKGIVECQGRLVLAGVLEGRVSGGILKIAETGRLSGDVHNREVECAGHLQGDIVTESFILRRTGCHVGTAETRKLTVDPGAVLDCVLQSGMAMPENRAAAAGTDRQGLGSGCELSYVLTAFQEESLPCCLDIPWSARRQLFSQLLALLQENKPLIMVTGEQGSGKSVLVEKLCRNAPEGCEFLKISVQADSPAALLQAVAAELGLGGTENLGLTELLAQVKAVLNDKGSRGQRVVLLLDEAEAMDPAVMEAAASLLTNAFDGGEEILQLVLFGTEKMAASMRPAIRKYFAETDCQLRIPPLSLKDTADYLRFCLQLAAAGNGSASLAFLPDETIRTLHVLSRGNIARINRLADQALQRAYAAGAQAIYPDYL